MSFPIIMHVGPDSLPEIQQIGRQTFYETFCDTNDEAELQKYLDQSFHTEKLIAELNHPCSQFYLARINGDVAGYLKLNTGDAQTEFQQENELEIERIYVRKPWWGKAVGQALMDFSLKVAAEKQVSAVWLGVWEHNHRAIRFYEKNGFEVFDKHIFRIGDKLQTDLLMRLLPEPR